MDKKTKSKLLDFNFKKKSLGFQLMIIGLCGLFLPILPGIILIYFGIKLFFPNMVEKILKRD
jgi:hypothetical protein